MLTVILHNNNTNNLPGCLLSTLLKKSRPTPPLAVALVIISAVPKSCCRSHCQQCRRLSHTRSFRWPYIPSPVVPPPVVPLAVVPSARHHPTGSPSVGRSAGCSSCGPSAAGRPAARGLPPVVPLPAMLPVIPPPVLPPPVVPHRSSRWRSSR